MTPAMHFEVEPSGRVMVDLPAGWLHDPEREALRTALGAIRPTLARASAPPLPPRDTWPEAWREVWCEREAIAWEGGAPDPEAVADADLRLMVARDAVPDVP